MKTVPKTSAAATLQRKATQPFFGKGGTGSFLGSSPFIQAKLTVGQPNDPYEREADQMADQVVQRLAQSPTPFSPNSTSQQPPLIQAKCADCEGEEKLQKKEDKREEKPEVQTKPIFESAASPPDDDIQRKCANCEAEDGPIQRKESNADESTASSALESQLSASKGGGSPLPEDTRQQMEGSMGADFSGVRVHTGSGAVQMSQDLNAHAFTHGSDIYFNSGKYDTESSGGQHLLAHELTHTMQQGGSESVDNQVNASSLSIQKAGSYYAPLRGGNAAHSDVTTVLGTADGNLLSEVKIPGANRFGPGETGRADFYKANKTIGIQFIDNQPAYLNSYKSLKKGIDRYPHVQEAAPVGSVGFPRRYQAIGCSNIPNPAICRLDSPPTDIKIGELKPADEAERILGGAQVQGYVTGIKSTAAKVNTFIGSHPQQVSGSTPWNPDPKPMDLADLPIPSDFVYPSQSAANQRMVVRYYNGRKYASDQVPAHLYIVPDLARPGVFYYEYIPIDQSINTAAIVADQRAVNERLATLKQKLSEEPQIKPKRKQNAGLPNQVTRSAKSIRRKPTDPFKHSEWNTEFATWKRNLANPFMKSHGSEAVDVIILKEIKARSFPSLPVPSNAEEVSSTFKRIQHWEQYGAIYGQLRAVFGRVYVRVANLYERLRTRFKRLLQSGRQALKKSSGIMGAIIRTGVLTLRQLAKLLMEQVMDRLTVSFQGGIRQLMNQLFDDSNVSTLTDKVAEVQTYITQMGEAARFNIEQVIQPIIEPYQKLIDQIQPIISTLSDLASIVNKVKWGIKVASCGLPPLLGCLWGVVGSTVVEEILEGIVNSCRFRRDVLFPALNKVDFLRNMPAQIADFILTQLRKVLPTPLHVLLGQPDQSTVSVNASQVECNSGKELSPEQQAMADLYDKHGEETMNAFLELMEHQGASSGTELTMDKVRDIDSFLQTNQLTAEQIRQFIRENEPKESSGTLTGTLQGLKLDNFKNKPGTTPPDPASPSTPATDPSTTPAPQTLPVDEFADYAKKFPLWKSVGVGRDSIYFFSKQQIKNAQKGQIIQGIIYTKPARNVTVAARIRVEITNISSSGTQTEWTISIRSFSDGVSPDGKVYSLTSLSATDTVRFPVTRRLP